MSELDNQIHQMLNGYTNRKVTGMVNHNVIYLNGGHQLAINNEKKIVLVGGEVEGYIVEGGKAFLLIKKGEFYYQCHLTEVVLPANKED